MKVFGSPAYVTDLKIIDKFQPRAIPCIFLGYLENQKGYLLLNLKTDMLFVSHHVSFAEHVFPFRDTSLQQQRGVHPTLKEMFWFESEPPRHNLICYRISMVSHSLIY